MSSEGKFSWDFLKTVADSLDSYRVRALIDAKEDIINAGVYDETQYYNILFKMFNMEQSKFTLFHFLNSNQNLNLTSIKKFSEKNSIELRKALSLLELLKNEKRVIIEEIYEKIKRNENSPDKLIFKDLSIKIDGYNVSNIQSIYEPVIGNGSIVDTNNCSGCGLCHGICPMDCIKINNGFGEIDDKKCIRCGLCYFICPRSYLPVKVLNMSLENTSEIKEYSEIGYYIEVYSARTKIKEIASICQDGGISSTCLYYLFEQGKIDYALGAKMSDDPWRPEPLLIKSKEDIISTAGTKYVNNPNLSLLNDLNENSKSIAVVGVPCQMQALLKSKIYNIGIPSLNNIEYRIGIFCMESFSYQSLLEICKTLNVDVKNVKKMDINKGKFFVYTKNGDELNVPIKDISHLAREDCEVCYDLTSESADISIGSIGSPSGWNTLVIRTEKGKQLYNELLSNKLIESKPISEVKPGLTLLKRIANSKKNNCRNHIYKKKENNKRIPIY